MTQGLLGTLTIGRMCGICDGKPGQSPFGQRGGKPIQCRVGRQIRPRWQQECQTPDPVDLTRAVREPRFLEGLYKGFVGREEELKGRAFRNLMNEIARGAKNEAQRFSAVGRKVCGELFKRKLEIGRGRDDRGRGVRGIRGECQPKHGHQSA